MKVNKWRQPRQPVAKRIVPKRRKVPKLGRPVAKGDVVIPKKGVWAGEECLVLDVEKRPQPYGYYRIVHVLLPNQRQRWYSLTDIKDIIPGRGAILTKARQQESAPRVPNEKLNVEVVIRPLIGTAGANLERAKHELNRVLSFRGDVISGRTKGSRIILTIAVNPKWESDDKVSYLKEWIPPRVRTVFEVLSVSEGEHE
jgi:hypothetical protein